MSPFKFHLHQIAKIAASGEQGEIIGRAEYTTAENTYLVRYRAGDGRGVQQWWDESALEAVQA